MITASKIPFIPSAIIVISIFITYTYADNQVQVHNYNAPNELETAPEKRYQRPLAKNQPWRPVQEQVRDTVVQVFTQKAHFDWLQPFRTPEQYAVRGSGFIISDQGEIITNWHVIDEAVAVWIQIPSLGKRLIKVNIIGLCPSKDIALLRIDDQDLELIKETLGRVPFLPLGNSDEVRRADETLALGYPLGQEALKSTSGIISGLEQHYLQISTPINPGSSGGPLINIEGQVIGINYAGVTEAQNVGYAIPINDFKVSRPDLYKSVLLKKPFLGILSVKVNDYLTESLGNPVPGGCYVVEVVKNSPLEEAGVQPGDMIYELNSNRIDVYGEMNVPWSEDKVSITDYVARLALGEEVQLVLYRNGDRKEFSIKATNTEVSPVHMIYPWHEEVDYEVFAGMVIMPLTINHIKLLAEIVPGLMRYTIMNYQTEPVLVIAHIFPNSELAQLRTLTAGFTINEVNGMPVRTLDDFREAIAKSLENNRLAIKATDQVTCTSDNIPVVLPFDIVLKEVVNLAKMYHYPISDCVQSLLKAAEHI